MSADRRATVGRTSPNVRPNGVVEGGHLMDIAGARTLKGRLDSSSTDEARGLSADVPQDALPVYQWLGISPRSSETSPEPQADEAPETPGA